VSTRADAGFTLPEALVALVIVAAALVPLLGAAAGAVRAQAEVGAALEAVALAEARMAALELLPADSVAGYGEPRTGAFEAPFAHYRWRALVRPADGTPGVLQAAVVVEWDRGEFALETFFRRPDLPAAGRDR
jgi:prepilin-type N-terminal cleavage/methylation domain-containing protein